MPYCDRCDRSFRDFTALHQHEANSSSHNVCWTCDLDFPTRAGIISHWVNSRQHSYCMRCSTMFDDDDELQKHFVDDHYYCVLCRKHFSTQRGLDEHDRQVHGPLYYECHQCGREFQTQNSLDAHSRSGVHSARTHICPGRDCGRSFISNAHLVAHLETGTCRSGVTRERLNQYVARRDTSGLITNPNRLLTGPGGTSSHTIVTQYATERSWNGSAYECILCHRTCRTLSALNTHLSSPAHANRIFRCPSQFGGCASEFSTLSGLMQHVESGRCAIHRFRSHMDRTIDSTLSGIGRIGWR